MNLVAIILIVALVIAAVYYGIGWWYGTDSRIIPLTPSSGTLDQRTALLDAGAAKANLFGNEGSTFSVYLKMGLGDRTPKAGDNMTPLIDVPNIMNISIGPPSSGSKNYSAQLTVYTIPTGGLKAKMTETVQLPEIPMQKWVYLTVLRMGRRFDIMYNDKVVFSHRFNYMPVFTESPLFIGATGLSGVWVLPQVGNYRLTTAEVVEEHRKTSDTRGQPREPLPLNPFAGLQCPGGDCSGDTITVRPSKAGYAWSTPYA